MEDSQILRSMLADRLSQARILIDLVMIAWIVNAVNFWLLGTSLNEWGIRPRVIGRLWAIPLSVFLHSSWSHLEGNTCYFLVFGSLILFRDPTDFAVVTWVVFLMDGFGTWLFGRAQSNQIGASGIVFGYLGFLMMRGYFDNNLPSALLTAVAFFFYGRMLWGILPLYQGVSWEGHLVGLLGGVLTARHLTYLKGMFGQLGAIFHQIGLSLG